MTITFPLYKIARILSIEFSEGNGRPCSNRGLIFFDAFPARRFHNGVVQEQYGLKLLNQGKCSFAGRGLPGQPGEGMSGQRTKYPER
jgi:hypothetical protein